MRRNIDRVVGQYKLVRVVGQYKLVRVPRDAQDMVKYGGKRPLGQSSLFARFLNAFEQLGGGAKRTLGEIGDLYRQDS